ncbi:hypothetical protein LJC55_01705 [Eubacteriales bacterium OttesenSCG-928-N14]|nr:hypothetical protein [Eubacteriales bacterium OttesenSCG-928-N14]
MMAELYIYETAEPRQVLLSFLQLQGLAIAPAKANDLEQAPPPGFAPPEGFVLPPDFKERTVEAHLPVVQVGENTVRVQIGKDLHMMEAEHYIEWILLQTDRGGSWKNLVPGDEPVAVFATQPGETVVAAYAYCNLHGLWKKDAKGQD